MTRQLTITAAEWASVTDGRLWLVREGERLRTECHCSPNPPTLAGQHSPHCNIRRTPAPPVEVVQACAPCPEPMCRSGEVQYPEWEGDARPCPDCRIELVGPCLLCGGSGRTLCGPLGEDVGDCGCVMTEGLITFGYAYAVGQPLPIITQDLLTESPVVVVSPLMGQITHIAVWPNVAHTLTAALAHYGPPKSLVGKWAIELVVQP